MSYEEFSKLANSLIRAINSKGSISIGMHSKNTLLLENMIKLNKDYALFQDSKIIGYIKDGKVVWL